MLNCSKSLWCVQPNCMSHPISRLHLSHAGKSGASDTTAGFHGASVHGLKATSPLRFRPSAFKLPTLSSNSSTMSRDDARRNSLFPVLVACPAEPIAAETGSHEQDRCKRKVFAASQL